MALKVTETNNALDSSGEAFGIKGQWFWLPVGGILVGILSGLVVLQNTSFSLMLGFILGVLLFFLARYLSNRHRGWIKFFGEYLKNRILANEHLVLHAGRKHTEQFTSLRRSE